MGIFKKINCPACDTKLKKDTLKKIEVEGKAECPECQTLIKQIQIEDIKKAKKKGWLAGDPMVKF